MAKVIIGNASAITVPRQDRDSIRRFYCDALGGKIMKEDKAHWIDVALGLFPKV
jgi:extradiol dioxygenase family protein